MTRARHGRPPGAGIPLLPVLILVAAGCACPPLPPLQRYAESHLGTPEDALDYFRLAILRKDPYHQFLCFSEEIRQANPDLTVANLANYQDRLLEMVQEEIGDINNLDFESTTIHQDRPFLATVMVVAGPRRQGVTLILETAYSIIWTDGTATHGRIPAGANPIGLRSGRIQADVSIRDRIQREPGTSAAQVHSLILHRDWKILRTERGPLADALRRKIEGAPAPAP